MKKRLLVTALLMGAVLMVSFSVFAATDSVTIIHSFGFGGSANVSGNGTHRIVTVTTYFTNWSDKYAVATTEARMRLNFDLGTLSSNSSINGLNIENENGCIAEATFSTYLSKSPIVWVSFPNGLVLAPYEQKVISFDIVYDVLGGITANDNPLVGHSYPTFSYKTPEEITYSPTEISLLDRIRRLLEKQQDGSDLDPATDVTDDINDKEDVIHQQEMQWYQQNQYAIESVGLSNFQFSTGALSGLQIMQQQFGDIWSAIGDLNMIFVFTLLMSLATFILRHWPHTKESEVTISSESNRVTRNNRTGKVTDVTSYNVTTTRTRRK